MIFFGWLASGISEGDIICDFPDLTKQDIRAALAFASGQRQANLIGIISPLK